MKRRLFTILSALSLMLCIGAMLLWVSSYSTADAIGYGGRWTGAEVAFADGRLFFWRWTTDDPAMMPRVLSPGLSYTPTSPMFPRANRLPGGRITTSFYFAGTHANHHRLTTPPFSNEIWYVYVPCWQVVSATALLPLIWLVVWHPPKRRQAFRAANGLCMTCGYDLRASSDRCPECGTPIAPTPDSPQSGTA